jgi:hypothetical protein
MVTRIHRPLKVIAFNVNGIMRQRYELSKQLQDLHIHVSLFSAHVCNIMRGSLLEITKFIETTATRTE